jgi:type VI protein secretion system component VasK
MRTSVKFTSSRIGRKAATALEIVVLLAAVWLILYGTDNSGHYKTVVYVAGAIVLFVLAFLLGWRNWQASRRARP